MKHTKVHLIIAILSFLAVMVAGRSVYGQSGTTIRACYDKKNGQLRIAAPTDCTPSELVINLNTQSAINHDTTLIGNGGTIPLGVAPGGVGTNQLTDGSVTAVKIASGQVVKSLNGLKDNVTLAAGSNVTITPSGNTLTIAAMSNGSSAVLHDATLTGDGTSAGPLGISVPLTLSSNAGKTLTVINNGGIGVYGKRGAGSGIAPNLLPTGGVVGDSEGDGVAGIGTSTGVSGYSTGSGGIGVLGSGGGSDAFTHAGIGVSGQGGIGGGGGGGAFDSSGGTGVQGEGGSHTTLGGNGVVGIGGNADANPGSVGGIGIVGIGGTGAPVAEGNGLAGLFKGSVHVERDLLALGTVTGSIIGKPESGSTEAGQFQGNVTITGNLQVNGAKSFIIDHPLDPEHKYLLHAAIESSEVLDLYSGKILLDAKGEAVVQLPDWFEALNKDFRYSLTPIGGASPNLYIAQEIAGNRFKIAGGAPNLKISWQVSGVRSDAAMLKRPFKIEQEKPESERGSYLNPQAFGQSTEKSITRAAKEAKVSVQQKPQSER